ncbi:MAG: hypothetical protein AB8H80_00735 [Planctomycetota bacterium]
MPASIAAAGRFTVAGSQAVADIAAWQPANQTWSPFSRQPECYRAATCTFSTAPIGSR